MFFTVTGKKPNLPPGKGTSDKRGGGRTERGFDFFFFCLSEALQLVKATAADDANCCAHDDDQHEPIFTITKHYSGEISGF